MRLLSFVFLLALVVSTTVQLLAAPPTGKVIPLSDGITKLDLTGQQSDGMVILAHRENFNAHSFDVLSLYIKAGYESPNAPICNLIPVFDDNKERLTVTIGGGADCILHDFRLVRDSDRSPLRLIIADRSLGDEGFAGANAVTFSFYVLRINKEGEVGRPLYYFERTSQSKAKHKYCDVGEAFKNELGLGDYRKSLR